MIGIEAEATLGEDCPKARASAEAGTFLLSATGSVAAATGWLISPILPSLIALRAAKCFSTSIFLMRAKAAPVVLLYILCGLLRVRRGYLVELLQASRRCVDRATNGFARYDEFHSPVLLPSSGVIVRGYGQSIAEARGAD